MQHHSEDFRFTDDFGIARCTGGRKEGPRMAYNSCRDKKKRAQLDIKVSEAKDRSGQG